MDRREAVQTILLASATTVFITGCAEANVVDFLKDGQLQLDAKHKDYLSAISESILPIKDVSDKIEAPINFIMRMLNDCRNADDITTYATGFDQYKVLMQTAKESITTIDTDTAVDIIKSTLAEKEPQEELVYFLQQTKQLSIQNLKSSAYFLTTKTDYQLIPEAYQACVDA